MVPWHTIEIYAAGTIAMDKIDSDASAIAHFLCAVHPHCTTIQNRLRLHTPNNLPVNKTVMAYILIKELHCRGKYLDLTIGKVFRHKLSILDEFLEFHDEWLGKISNCLYHHPAIPIRRNCHEAIR